MKNENEDFVLLFKESFDYMSKKLIDCEAMVRQSREEARRNKEEIAQMEARLTLNIESLELLINKVGEGAKRDMNGFLQETDLLKKGLNDLGNKLKEHVKHMEHLEHLLNSPQRREVHMHYFLGKPLIVIVPLLMIICWLAVQYFRYYRLI